MVFAEEGVFEEFFSSAKNGSSPPQRALAFATTVKCMRCGINVWHGPLQTSLSVQEKSAVSHCLQDELGGAG
jgi:hypothetical protein